MSQTAKTAFLEDAKRRVLVAPSLLACDFSNLGEEVRRAEAAGADMFHLDVMDGHFVPNITVGPLAMKAVRPHTKLPVEAHLMISDPTKYAPRFAEAGADAITFHVEAVQDPKAAARVIGALGVAVGVSLNPATPWSAIEGLRGDVDFVLVMTVVPGFGGQKFMPEPLEKARRIAAVWGIPVGLDGGIGPETAAAAGASGATMLVAGSAVYGWPDLKERIELIRSTATRAREGR